MLNAKSFLCVALTATLLTGCVNTPTQKASVKDNRPLIMFEAARSGDMLVLDGIEIGPAIQYRSGRSALKIEPGTHQLEIVRDGQVIQSERFYLSRGTSKTFNIQNN